MNEIQLKYNFLKQRQSLDLESKIIMTQRRIKEWYEHFDGEVYVAFSGGKDSTVLLDIVRSIYPEVPAVFCDTGLEYPEIRKFVKSIDNVIWVKPKMSFKTVLEKYGYPVISKKIARFIRDIQNASDKNKATVNLRLTGFNRKGIYCPSMKIPKKWLYLTHSDIKISDYCCDIIKKQPLKYYQKNSKKMPIIGTMACESNMREKQYINQGCNAFNSKTNPISMPISFWLEEDIWEYIRKYDIPYSEIYNMGEKRTGCMFCMFGVHLEKEPNRFQRMKITHPKLWEYCIYKLNLKKVLDYINVSYE